MNRGRDVETAGFRNVEQVLNLAADWQSTLAVVGDASAGVHEFTKRQAVAATMDYFSGQLEANEANIWATWVLSRADVRIDDDRVGEFLKEWSDRSIAISRDSVDVWQSRLAHD